MPLYVGFAAYFSSLLFEAPAQADHIAKLCMDPRWLWPLTSVTFGVRATFGKRTKRQRLTEAHGRARLRNGFVDLAHRDAVLDHRADAESNHARLHLETGQRLADQDWPFPATLTGLTKAFDLPEGADLLAWIGLMHEVMLALDVGHAVLPVWPTEHMVDADTTFVGVLLDTPKATYNMGVHGDFNTQRKRANYWRPELGDKYLRHPRWGTYLRRAHLERVGGLARLRDTVPLAQILELGGPGDLLYLQCTDHPKGALTAEGEQVRQALQAFIAPILVPPRPQELAAAPA